MSGKKSIHLSDFLNQQYLCESLTIKEVQTLIDFTEEVVFSKDAIIADVGEVGEALYFVIKGAVALFYSFDGQTIEIGNIGGGELVGEMSFFDREPRSVRLLAMSADTRLLRLSRTMYKRLRVEHPYIAVNLLEHAIINLDHLFRRVSKDMASCSNHLQDSAKK